MTIRGRSRGFSRRTPDTPHPIEATITRLPRTATLRNPAARSTGCATRNLALAGSARVESVGPLIRHRERLMTRIRGDCEKIDRISASVAIHKPPGL